MIFFLSVFNSVYAFSCGTHCCSSGALKAGPILVKPRLNLCNGVTLGVSHLQSGVAESSIGGCMEWISVQLSKVAFCVCISLLIISKQPCLTGCTKTCFIWPITNMHCTPGTSNCSELCYLPIHGVDIQSENAVPQHIIVNMPVGNVDVLNPGHFHC